MKLTFQFIFITFILCLGCSEKKRANQSTDHAFFVNIDEKVFGLVYSEGSPDAEGTSYLMVYNNVSDGSGSSRKAEMSGGIKPSILLDGQELHSPKGGIGAVLVNQVTGKSAMIDNFEWQGLIAPTLAPESSQATVEDIFEDLVNQYEDEFNRIFPAKSSD